MGPLETLTKRPAMIILVIIGGLVSGAYFAWQSGYLNQFNLNALTGGLINTNADPTPTPAPSQTETTPVPEPTQPASPTPFPRVEIPSGWQTYQHSQCPFKVSIPSNWTTQADCVPATGSKTDCLQTDTFSGQIEPDNIKVDQGMIFTFSCSPTEITDTQSLLADCRQRIALTAEEAYTCQMLNDISQNYIMFKEGQYQTIINQQLITIMVYPPPPTTFNLITQIFQTLQPSESVF